jgi:putative chromate ion transporter
MILGLSFVAFAALMVIASRSQLERELPGIAGLFTATNLPVLALSVLFVKILHELGHGLTCRHFGGECHELGVLFVGFMPLLYCDVSDSWLQQDSRKRMLVSAAGIAGAAASTSFNLWTLWLFFLKVGSVLYGSGYVLLAFLRADLVERYGWLTEKQLLDAVAVGQVTPGPVFTTATFIGYVLGGGPGAAVATLGIFLPAFVFVALSGPLVPRLRRSATAGDVLDGVNAASLALMAAVTLSLGRAALVDGPTAVLAGVAAVLLLRWRVNSTWLVLGGAAAGLLLRGGAW